MGAFYTHLTDVPGGIAVNSKIRRGDLLGKVHHGHRTPHLHLALVEIIGGAPGGRYVGVDLFRHFVSTANSTAVSHVTFHQSGSPPTVS
jgi:hypothetical protein